MKNTKIRESNYELLRIISMVLIIAFHTFRYIELSDVSRRQMAAFHAVRWYGLLGVNCFLLTSAHFMIGKKSNPHKLIPLITQTLFYCIFFLICKIIYSFASGNASFLLEEIKVLELEALFSPLWSNRYWFITVYIFLYLLIPALNTVISRMTALQYRRLLLLLTGYVFFYLSIAQNLEHTAVTEDILWAVYVYLLAGYLKLWKPDNWIKRHCVVLLPILWLLFIGTRMLMTYEINDEHLYYLLYHTTGNSMRYSFIMLLMALCLFYLFQSLHFQSRMINTISGCTLGIYLFHDNKVFHVCELLATKLYDPFLKIIPSFAAFLLFLVIIQFMAGTVLELLRQKLFSLFTRRKAAP